MEKVTETARNVGKRKELLCRKTQKKHKKKS